MNAVLARLPSTSIRTSHEVTNSWPRRSANTTPATASHGSDIPPENHAWAAVIARKEPKIAARRPVAIASRTPITSPKTDAALNP